MRRTDNNTAMSERLSCGHCRRVVELPAIEDDTLADKEFAEFFGIPVGGFLCFWCWLDFDGSLGIIPTTHARRPQ
jgi:hypothetical protein